MKQPVYRDPSGAEISPVEFVGTLWMNNTLPCIAMDAVAQFILLNALENAGRPYDRSPLAMSGDGDDDKAAWFSGLLMRQARVKRIRSEDLMRHDYWYGPVPGGKAVNYGCSPRAMLDEDMLGMLDRILLSGRVVDRSMRASLLPSIDINTRCHSTMLLLYLTWLEKEGEIV